jgi:hypothetical protein
MFNDAVAIKTSTVDLHQLMMLSMILTARDVFVVVDFVVVPLFVMV